MRTFCTSCNHTARSAADEFEQRKDPDVQSTRITCSVLERVSFPNYICPFFPFLNQEANLVFVRWITIQAS